MSNCPCVPLGMDCVYEKVHSKLLFCSCNIVNYRFNELFRGLPILDEIIEPYRCPDLEIKERTVRKMRLIDADKMREDWLCGGENEYVYNANSVLDSIDEQPTVDAVEVVRCKDCLYSRERYGHMECIHGVAYRNTWNKPDFFCSYGERRVENDS